MQRLSSEIKKGTYENIFVDCPNCHKELIFNRISDLKTIMPISGQELICEYCQYAFWANGDRVTSAKYRWFLEDLPILKKQKRYGLCIFSLCQACETFMHQAIINKLIDKNTDCRDQDGHFWDKNKVGAEAYNQIYDEFCNKKISDTTNNGLKNETKYREAAFNNLRTLFLFIFDGERQNKLPSLKKLKKDKKRAKNFYVIEKTDINETRNKIVHKNTYRPSFCDVQKYDELFHSLYWLGTYLNVKDSLFYINKKIIPTNTVV